LDENENNKDEKGEKTKREVDVSKLRFI